MKISLGNVNFTSESDGRFTWIIGEHPDGQFSWRVEDAKNEKTDLGVAKTKTLAKRAINGFKRYQQSK